MEDLTEVIVELEPSDDELRAAGHTDPKPDQEPVSESDPPDCTNKPLPVMVTWRNTLSTDESDATEEPLTQPAAAAAAADSRRSVAFFAVFDGHGGREAALFARDHLWDFLKKQRGFWSKDYRKVCAAIRKGFIACHHAMWKKLRKLLALKTMTLVLCKMSNYVVSNSDYKVEDQRCNLRPRCNFNA